MCYRTLAVLALALTLGGAIAAPSARAADTITLDARLAQPVMKNGVAARNYLRVAVGGCRPEEAAVPLALGVFWGGLTLFLWRCREYFD